MESRGAKLQVGKGNQRMVVAWSTIKGMKSFGGLLSTDLAFG